MWESPRCERILSHAPWLGLRSLIGASSPSTLAAYARKAMRTTCLRTTIISILATATIRYRSSCYLVILVGMPRRSATSSSPSSACSICSDTTTCPKYLTSHIALQDYCMIGAWPCIGGVQRQDGYIMKRPISPASFPRLKLNEKEAQHT